MAAFTYSSPAGRINQLKGEIVAHSVPVEVLGITGMQREIPRNKGKTVIYRRYRPFGALATSESTKNRWVVDPLTNILSEGVTPTSDTLVPDNITVTLNQYGCLYQVTDQVYDTYEDDVPAEMKKQCGERVGLIRELVRYGVVKAIGNVFYPGGVSSRATVANKISLGVLQKASRNLQANHAKRITGILAPSQFIGTKPIEASYLVFCHTDCESDLRALSGWKNVAEYGSRKVAHEQEIGSVENFRFITSPELAPYPNAGVAVGATGLVATSTNVDVYPFIICGEDAWGQVALRGADSLEPVWIPPGERSKSDPLAQRGFIGAKFYFNCTALNEGWIAVIEAGVTNLVT